jgi:hypothetical protein
MKIADLSQLSKPHAALRALDRFAGHWHVKGENLTNAPLAPEMKVKGDVDYKWMPGAFFMVSNWKWYFQNGAHIGLSIIGYDTHNCEFFSQNFDNMGYLRIYRMARKDQTWRLIGENERAVISFDETGNKFTEDWQIKTDSGWQPLCHLEMTRFGANELTTPES